MNVGDIDIFEVNEAFAVVPLRLMDHLKVDHSIVNVNGGAIAMGQNWLHDFRNHLDELERQNKSTALATAVCGRRNGNSNYY
jgi:acetyl-CoA C-acetyltransferase